MAFLLRRRSVAPVALLSLSALVAAKLSEARVAPAASLPMAAAQPTIDLDESIAALAARAHVSAHNKDMLQDKMLQQGVGNVAELLTAIQGGTSATALGFPPAALALCERVLPDKTLRSAEAAAAALAASCLCVAVRRRPAWACGWRAGGRRGRRWRARPRRHARRRGLHLRRGGGSSCCCFPL